MQCKSCGVEFEYVRVGAGRPPSYCSVCRVAVDRIIWTRYDRSVKGSIARRERTRNYRKTEKGADIRRISVMRWKQTEKGIEWYRERYSVYGSSSSWWFKGNYLIFVIGKPCARCGEINKALLRCDHITPRHVLAWYGQLDIADRDENLQVLCVRCHHKKTQGDLVRNGWWVWLPVC
jgi:5-methylcytosine-specific restriction endonuclease McrA